MKTIAISAARKSLDVPVGGCSDFAGLLFEQGENIKYIQSRLGHSSPTVTLNVYAHLMKDRNSQAACRLENSVFGGTGHHLGTRKEKGSRLKTATP